MSREKILNEIRKNKPAATELPFFSFSGSEGNNTEKYLEVLHAIGGKGKLVDGWEEVASYLNQKREDGVEVVNGIPELASYNIEGYREKDAADIESVHAVFLQGETALAENSAIWLSERQMVNRLFPFLCQELIVVIKEEAIVSNMHEAYAKISVDDDGYGVFIAGPSKTADIEQSLVIGAHGPLALQVFILKAGTSGESL
jgi:L-lactate dehydrogenase complex protein LldG